MMVSAFAMPVKNRLISSNTTLSAITPPSPARPVS